MKAQGLVKGKKVCPFLLDNFKLDITKNPITKDFIRKYGASCPYLYAGKIQKQNLKVKETLKHALNQCTSSAVSYQSSTQKKQNSNNNCQNPKCDNAECKHLCQFQVQFQKNSSLPQEQQEQELSQALENLHKAFQIDTNFDGKQVGEMENSSKPIKCPYASLFMQNNAVQEMKAEQVIEQKVDQYQHKFSEAIDKLKTEKRYRVFNHIQRIVGKYPKATMEDVNGNIQEITVWCSNDYLGMGQIKEVQDAMIDSIRVQGIGAGGTRNIGGSSTQHLLLEQDLADFHSKEAAVVCSSGFVANQAALNALKRVMPNIVYLSDEKNHASIIEGISNSKAQKMIWKHNDLEDLESKLKQLPLDQPKCVVFESVYSMSGTIAPIQDICELSKRYNALTFIDEVHAIGLYGPKGAGVAQQMGMEHLVDFISGTMSKGIGCFGGYVVGKTEAIDCIRSYAPNFIFTTSIPPAVAAAARKSLELIQSKQELRDKLHSNAHKIKARFYELGIQMEPSQSHIVPVFIGSAERAKQISDLLLIKYGHYIQPINFPTVARGEELLRISPTPNHDDDMIEELAQSLLKVYEEVGQPLAHQNLAEVFIQRGFSKFGQEQLIPFDSRVKESFFPYGLCEKVLA